MSRTSEPRPLLSPLVSSEDADREFNQLAGAVRAHASIDSPSYSTRVLQRQRHAAVEADEAAGTRRGKRRLLDRSEPLGQSGPGLAREPEIHRVDPESGSFLRLL
jgi:hypothetical protein